MIHFQIGPMDGILRAGRTGPQQGKAIKNTVTIGAIGASSQPKSPTNEMICSCQ